ncbi:unnamed protein product [Linum tenue]|uniref:SH3 domain-containing protein n=1 Tax=Linum tenue TaxID=586396 RepID=A0AAV0KRS7_9ROSI|nr:unnamed protein product [Linum tenue]
MEAIRKQATRLREQVAKQQQAVLKQFGASGYGGSDGLVTDEAEFHQHQRLEKLYISTRAGKRFDIQLCSIGTKLSEDSRKYGSENTCTSGNTLSKAALNYGRARAQMEKERGNLLKALGTQVAEPLRAMVMGAPLEDARHLAQRYDRMRQETEAQAIEVSKRQARAREMPGHPEVSMKWEAAESKLQDLKANMDILGKEATAAMAAVEAQQQRLTLQRLISMVESERTYHQRVLQILDQLETEMISERQRIEAPPPPVENNNMPPPPPYEEVNGVYPSQTQNGSTDSMGYFLGEVMHPYNAETSVELSLSVGDYVVVRKVTNNGWAEGECKGKAEDLGEGREIFGEFGRMGHVVRPLDKLSWLPEQQAGCGFGLCHPPTAKASLLHLNSSLKFDHIIQHQLCVRPKEYLRAERSLTSRIMHESALIDEVDDNEWESGLEPIDQSSTEHDEIRKKDMSLQSSSSDGRIVENEQETNNEILHNLCSRGRLLDAAKLIDTMARRSQIPGYTCCTNLIRGLIRMDRMDKAVKVLKIMVLSGGVPDVITYNMMVGGFCKRGHVNSAVDLLDDMSLSGCPPDVITYNTIIRAMFERGNFELAIKFWKVQVRRGCPPYLITYTVLIELVCKHCGAVRAVEVLEDMANEGCFPDLVTYNSLVNLTCKQGKFEDAALVLSNILSHGMEPNAVTYNTLIHSLSSCGYWDEADEILALMKISPYSPTVVTYNILINGLCKCGDLVRAIDFFNQMVDQNCSPDIITYNTLFAAFCREGMVDEALELFGILDGSDCPPGLITYNTLIDGLGRRGYVEKALGLYSRMLENGIKPDGITHRSLVWAFCWAGQVEEAVVILREMVKRDHRINGSAFKLVVQGLCRKQHVDTAIEVLELMISGRYKPDEDAYSAVIKGVADYGMINEADELHKKLIEMGILRQQSH